MNYFFYIFSTLFLFYIASEQRAQAYLDYGTGSYLFQIIIAGLVGILYTIKLFWLSIKQFILRISGKNRIDEDESIDE